MAYKWFPIFKTGKHIDSEGRPYEATTETLDRIVAANQGTERPLAIGHPKTSSPAWGQANAFKRVGEMLYALPNYVVPEFAEAVKKRLWDKVSISIRPDFTIRHIGFLGATPPAVKGLPVVEFKEESGAMTFEFSEHKMSIVARLFQRLRDLLIEKYDVETADRAIGSWDVEDLIREESPDAALAEKKDSGQAGTEETKAQQSLQKVRHRHKGSGNVTKPSNYADIPDDEFMDPVNYRYPMNAAHMQAAMSYWGMAKNREQYTEEEAKAMTKRMLAAAKKHGIEADESKWNFSEGGTDMEKEELERKLKEKEKEVSDFSEREKTKDARIRELEAKDRQRDHVSFCEGLMKEGKLTPAMKPAVLDFMEILSGAEEFEFAEADEEAGKSANRKADKPLERFKAFLKGLPKQVEFSEFATKAKAGEKPGSADESPVVAEARKRAEANKK